MKKSLLEPDTKQARKHRRDIRTCTYRKREIEKRERRGDRREEREEE